MPHLTEEQLDERRIAKVTGWLDWLDDAERAYEEIVLSRRSELASETGADPDPRLRPCEHRSEWLRGGLCLACDNTGLRKATEKERLEGLAYDPYLIDPPRTGYDVKRDTSEAARRAANMERLNAAISALQRDARIRAGVEVRDDAMTSLLRRVATTRRDHPTLRKVEWALAVIKRLDRGMYDAALRREPHALLVLSKMIPGRIQRAS